MEERRPTNDILSTIEQEMDSDVHPLLKKILDNLRPIGIAVGGIVAAVAVYTGVNSYQESQYEKAVSELGVIMTTDDLSARAEKLQAFAQSGPKTLRTAAQLELARIHMDQNEFGKAADAWRSVSQNADTRIIAGLGEAKALILGGEPAKAVEILSALKQNAGEEFVAAISANLAFAAEQAGQIELAIAEYEALKSKESGNEAFLEYKIGALKSKS
jgi:predicted negative regulator of RcsB-dependent stress response